MGNVHVSDHGCSSASEYELRGEIRSTKNQTPRTITQLFDVSNKCIHDQTEIQGVSRINWHTHLWQRATLLSDKVRLSTVKVFVFSDSVLVSWQDASVSGVN